MILPIFCDYLLFTATEALKTQRPKRPKKGQKGLNLVFVGLFICFEKLGIGTAFDVKII